MKVVFAYIPVVHKQVLEFLERHKGTKIWLLDNEKGAEENVYLERDARALSASLILIELKAHGFQDIEIVSPDALDRRTDEVEEIIIPEDEIVRFFLERNASQVPVKAENIFIRWTQQLSTAEHDVPPHRIVSTEVFHNEVLLTLEKEAQKSPDWWRQIAAAIIRNGEVISTAYNTHFPSPHSLSINGDPRSNLDAGKGPGIYTSIHAEAAAISRAAKNGVVTEGADAYVTTFPCPSCARLLTEAGIKRVFYKDGYSVLDAEEILGGAGIEIILVKDE